MADKIRSRQNKSFNRRWEIHRKIHNQARDILRSRNYAQTKYHIQHGTMSVRQHTINVARCSIAMSEQLNKLGIYCNQRALIRGALLHDYFLYDWHDKDHLEIHNLHGFYHPSIALDNAKKEYELSKLEQDIIKKHMWPLTVIPPMCREAWVVTAADKYCSTLETLRLMGEKRNRKHKKRKHMAYAAKDFLSRPARKMIRAYKGTEHGISG